MNKRWPEWQKILRHHQTSVVAALMLMPVVFMLVHSTDDWLRPFVLGQHMTTVLVGGFTLCMVGALFNFMINLSAPDEIGRANQQNLFAALGASLLAGFGYLYRAGTLHAEIFYFSTLSINGLIAYCLLYQTSINLSLSPRLANIVAGIHGGTLALLGLMAHYEGWSSSASLLVASGVLRDAMIGLFPLTVVALTRFNSRFRLSPNNFRESLALRLIPTPQNRIYLMQFYAITSFSFGYAIFSVAMATQSPPADEITNLPSFLPLYLLSLGWIPPTVGTLYQLHKNRDTQSRNILLANLAPEQARRFLLRHRSSQSNWAATIGLRTANFMIDHDPNDMVGQNLPSTLAQIRKDEIRRFVEKVLGNKLLHKRILGNQLYGSIDPEHSCHSCIDALRLIACIYIDAIPVVERRLKSLASLFPVIDPELADAVQPEGIEATMAQIEWIFHLDFDWVDQNLIHMANQMDYGVSADNLTLSHRYHVLSYLRKQNRLGNFVWLGEKVRERLLMEAPYLASTIETWPISMPEEETDVIIYLIKFEELIPRLQKYYNLEDTRQLINDYEPGKESRRILNMLDLQLTQTREPKRIMETLAALTSQQWRGFKEKDLALKVALKAFLKLRDMEVIDNPQNPLSATYRQKLLDVITTIGYPSQILHMAHMNKIRLRQVGQILEIARNPGHRRFIESWLLLTCINPHRYSALEIKDLVKLVESAIKEPNLKSREVVRTKAVEAFFNLAPCLSTPEESEMIRRLTNQLGQYLAEQQASIELCSFYLDAKIFLEDQIKESIPLEPATMQALGQHFNHLFATLGPKAPSIVGLTSRWRQLIQQQAQPAEMNLSTDSDLPQSA